MMFVQLKVVKRFAAFFLKARAIPNKFWIYQLYIYF